MIWVVVGILVVQAVAAMVAGFVENGRNVRGGIIPNITKSPGSP